MVVIVAFRLQSESEEALIAGQGGESQPLFLGWLIMWSLWEALVGALFCRWDVSDSV